MAEIRPYTSQIVAQGARADGNDFGAQIGAGLQNIGQGLGEVGTALYQQESNDEVTQAHVMAAQQRAKWQQELTDRANSADPSDKEFATRMSNDITQSQQDLAGQFKTRAGQQTFAKLSADMASMFGQEAVGVQSRLAGEDAKNKYTSSMASLGQIAAQDHTQWESLLKQAHSTIDTFTQVPQTTRDQLKEAAREKILYDTALGFARRYPDAVLGSVPKEIKSVVQQVQANGGKPPTPPGLPPNLNADFVKPYDQGRIDQVARRVDTPSPYDAYFEEAGRLYNIDPRELKLRAVVESSLDPRAVSQAGAKGLMQFTDATAAKYGLTNPQDPRESIMAGAKMMAEYKKKAGGDMATVDKMYYGGEGGTAWGPNTNQYAANLAAVRNSLNLGTPVQPAAFVAPPAVQAGDRTDWKKPTTGISFIDQLPADKFFDVLSKAEHYQRAQDTAMERDRMERDRQVREQQESVMKSMYARIIAPTPENGGPLSEREILDNTGLKFEQQQHMIQTKMARERELSANAEAKTNPAEVRRLMLEIHAADNDPRKTYNADDVMESYKAGRISTNEMMVLRKEVEQLRDGNTSGFQKDVQNARNAVYTSLTRSIIGQAQPEVAADAAYRFNADMERQIADLRKQNKDPRVLLDPNSRDYLLRPERIQSFMPGGSQSVSQAASARAAQEAKSLPTYKDYDKLASGASYTDPQGNVRVKK